MGRFLEIFWKSVCKGDFLDIGRLDLSTLLNLMNLEASGPRVPDALGQATRICFGRKSHTDFGGEEAGIGSKAEDQGGTTGTGCLSWNVPNSTSHQFVSAWELGIVFDPDSLHKSNKRNLLCKICCHLASNLNRKNVLS